MPRDASGNYTLPTGNPVVTETLITSVWANTTMSDLGSEMTDSLSRSGKGAMQAALRLIDKDGVNPGLAFRDELNSGWLREAAGDIRLKVLGQDFLKTEGNDLKGWDNVASIWFNLLNFIVVATDYADIPTAITDAVNRQRDIFVPAGEYTVDSTLIFPPASGQIIFGAGRTKTELKATQPITMVLFQSGGWTMRGFRMFNVAANRSNPLSKGIQLGDATNPNMNGLVLQDIRLEDGFYDLIFSEGLLDDVKFEAIIGFAVCGRSRVYLSATLQQQGAGIIFERCQFSAASGTDIYNKYGLYLAGADASAIRSCTINSHDVNVYVTETGPGATGNWAMTIDGLHSEERRSFVTDATTWVATTAFSLDTYVVPTTAKANGGVFKVTTAGTTGATEPDWPLNLNDTVVDGTVTFTRVASSVGIMFDVGTKEWDIRGMTFDSFQAGILDVSNGGITKFSACKAMGASNAAVVRAGSQSRSSMEISNSRLSGNFNVLTPLSDSIALTVRHTQWTNQNSNNLPTLNGTEIASYKSSFIEPFRGGLTIRTASDTIDPRVSQVVIADATAGNITITVDGASASSGQYCYVFKEDNSANTVTVKSLFNIKGGNPVLTSIGEGVLIVQREGQQGYALKSAAIP